MNLIEALQADVAKSREFLVELEVTAQALGHASTDDDPGLKVSKMLTEMTIAKTEEAIATNDVVAMVKIAQLLEIGA